jgi:hypothetical protein
MVNNIYQKNKNIAKDKMIDYIIKTLKGIFNNEGIGTEPEPKKKKTAKKPKGLNTKKKTKKK